MEITQDKIISMIDEIITYGKKALDTEIITSGPGVVFPDYLSGTHYNKFKSKLKLFTERYLKNYPLYEELLVCQKANTSISKCKMAIQHLETIRNDELFLEQFTDNNSKESGGVKKDNHKVFIVHGHDETTINMVKLFVHSIGYEPIILRNEVSGGLAIIDKFEKYAKEVAFAIVLYTACDKGKDKNKHRYNYRARQNVVFEHGYLISLLGRQNVVALVEKTVETPGDVDGVVYVSMSDMDWQQQIMKEMKAVGLSIDYSKAEVGALK